MTLTFFEWDFNEESVKRIERAIAQCGCTYVPFAIFAEPETFNWRDQYNWDFKQIKPPPGKLSMKREELWGSLFDYL